MKKYAYARRDAETQRFEINNSFIFCSVSAPLRLCARYVCSFRDFFTASDARATDPEGVADLSWRSAAFLPIGNGKRGACPCPQVPPTICLRRCWASTRTDTINRAQPHPCPPLTHFTECEARTCDRNRGLPRWVKPDTLSILSLTATPSSVIMSARQSGKSAKNKLWLRAAQSVTNTR